MHANHRSVSAQQKCVQRHVEETDSYAFFNLLTGPRMLEGVKEQLPVHRERLFPPTETLSMFMAQVLSADGSCQQAVNDAALKRVIEGLTPCSAKTSAYCQARARLPTAMITALTRQVGGMMTEHAPGWWHWQNRPVRLIDGATVTMPDTEENQAAYPQPASQKPGLGFPICRLVALLCLGSGALLNAATGPCKGKGSDEQTLFRGMLDTLNADDILLGDAFYPTYFLLCELVARGIDGVFEQHGARKRSTDFRTGKKLGVRDHLIVLEKPKKKPEWMTQEAYDEAPATLTVREFKAGGKVMVTTFLDAEVAPKNALKALYQRRWNVEIDQSCCLRRSVWDSGCDGTLRAAMGATQPRHYAREQGSVVNPERTMHRRSGAQARETMLGSARVRLNDDAVVQAAVQVREEGLRAGRNNASFNGVGID